MHAAFYIFLNGQTQESEVDLTYLLLMQFSGTYSELSGIFFFLSNQEGYLLYFAKY